MPINQITVSSPAPGQRAINMPKMTEASPENPSSHLCPVPGRRVKAATICMMPVTIAQAAIRKSKAKAVTPGQKKATMPARMPRIPSTSIQAALIPSVETEAGTREGQTRLIVAQRISAVLSADTIVVLDDGRIVAQGRHEELLATSAIYREIYESQLEAGMVSHGRE